jgi:four helix bundle protein
MREGARCEMRDAIGGNRGARREDEDGGKNMMPSDAGPLGWCMTYEQWEVTVPAGIRGDALWRVQAYRLASYLAAVADVDAELIETHPRRAKIAAQLATAASSIPANIAEGYVRLSARDRVRYYEYAYGSAAETKSRYVSASRAFPPGLPDARLVILNSISRLLLKMIQSGRLQSTDPDPSSVSPFSSPPTRCDSTSPS